MLRLTLFGRFALADAEGREIAVPARKARALLAYLALSPGMSRSREEIMALLWSSRAEAQARGSLRQVLSGLRKQIGDALVTDNERASLDPRRISVNMEGEQELLAGFHLNEEGFEEWLRDERLSRQAGKAAQVRDKEKPDIAVLPFENMASEPDQDAFCDGITEDIITELSRFSAFTVYSPWSSFSYDPDKTTEEIALELEIDYVLEGSVRRAGDRARITAMLFDVETVNHVWVQRYDRDLADIFAVQEEVAQQITTAVAAKIEVDAYEEALRRPEAQRSAYDYVLLGERAQHQDWTSPKAEAFYEKAISVEPDCARAYANLANWHASNLRSKCTDPGAVHPRVRALGEKALSLAPNRASVLASLSDAYVTIGENTLARQCVDKAIRLNPNHHSVMILAASTYAWLGEVATAQRWLARYQLHDPLWISAAMEVSLVVHYAAERYEEAVAAIARWSDLPLDLTALAAAAHAQCGRLDEAAALRAQYEARLPPGCSFANHIARPISTCPDAALVARWMEGFRAAGFDI